jgi:hypothetical protein
LPFCLLLWLVPDSGVVAGVGLGLQRKKVVAVGDQVGHTD